MALWQLVLTLIAVSLLLPLTAGTFEIGTGIYDVTPPISDILMMGMANPNQLSKGLHQRLRARAFVAYDPEVKKRFAFVSADIGMGGMVLNNRVLKILKKDKKLVDRNGKALYHTANVAISGTHTHSGPSGFLEYTIFQFAGSGWVENVIDAFAKGIAESIYAAHQNMEVADAYVNIGELKGAHINRSPTSYLQNPEKERARYKSNTDLDMTLLKFVSGEKELGMFNWFAVHPTSLNNTNRLVSGDNKGHASYLFEEWKTPKSVAEDGTKFKSTITGQGFVAAFAATNLGDVSPNTKGPHCRDTGLPCDKVHSTCNGRNELCSASGPGNDMYESCEIIARKQFFKAQSLYNNENNGMKKLSGHIDFAHTFVRMTGLNVTSPDGRNVGYLCKPAMGESFAAGTIDGPGMFDFTQGKTELPSFWNYIVDLLHKSTPEEVKCQHPKAILLPTGSLKIPYPWAPDVLPIQILKLGQFVILSIPSEFTTMAGRRLREHIKNKMVNDGTLDAKEGVVVIAGLSNGYSDYTVTFEEYQAQRYEAGSTIYGPHQLHGYMQELTKLADSMAKGTGAGRKSPPPEDFSSEIIHTGGSLHTDILFPKAKKFGDVLEDVESEYSMLRGDQIVRVTFAGTNPMNDLRTQDTFVKVMKCLNSDCEESVMVADDGDWETRIKITKVREEVFESARKWTVEWNIPRDTKPGLYRIDFFGTACKKNLFGHPKFSEFSGKSSIFKVGSESDSDWVINYM